MSKAQRVYALPPKLVKAFNATLKPDGFFINRALAAAILNYLNMPHTDQEACLDRYHAYASKHLGDDCNPRKRRTGRHRTRHSTLRPYRDRNAIMRLNIPPPDRQITIGGKMSKKEE